jgi:hypothetical protein
MPFIPTSWPSEGPWSNDAQVGRLGKPSPMACEIWSRTDRLHGDSAAVTDVA